MKIVQLYINDKLHTEKRVRNRSADHEVWWLTVQAQLMGRAKNSRIEVKETR